MGQAHHKLDSLDLLHDRLNVPLLVSGAVGAVDHDDQLDQFVFDLLSQRVFVLAWEVLRSRHRAQEDVVGLLVDRRMLVLRHDSARFVATALRAVSKWLND